MWCPIAPFSELHSSGAGQHLKRYRAIITGTRTELRLKTKVSFSRNTRALVGTEKSRMENNEVVISVGRWKSRWPPVPHLTCALGWMSPLPVSSPLMPRKFLAGLLLLADGCKRWPSRFLTRWAVAVKGIHAAVSRVGVRSQTARFNSLQLGKRVLCVCSWGHVPLQNRRLTTNNSQPILSSRHRRSRHSVHNRTPFKWRPVPGFRATTTFSLCLIL